MPYGERCPAFKLSRTDVAAMRKLSEDGVSQADLARLFGVSTPHAYYVVTGKKRVRG